MPGDPTRYPHVFVENVPGLYPSVFVDGAAYNVKGYGAIGDGVADDTAAIDTALAAIPAAGGTLYFPVGTFRRTTNLTIPSNVSVVGDGYRSALYFVDGGLAANIGIWVVGSNTVIANLRVTGNGAARTGVYGWINCNGSTRTIIRDCYIDNSPSTAIYAQNATRLLISGNDITDTWADGIHVNRQSSNVRIVGNHVTRTRDDAIAVVSNKDGATYTACTDVAIVGNTVRDINLVVGSGIKVSGGLRISIVGNVVDNVIANAITLGGVADATFNAGQDFTVTGNIISRATQSGIHCGGLDGATLSSNFGRTFGVRGIGLLGTSLRCSVVANTLTGGVERGIYEEAGSGPNVFVANVTKGNTNPNLINGGTGSVNANNLDSP